MCIKWDEWQRQPGHVPNVFRSAPWSLIMGNIWERHEIYAYLGKLTINVVIIATTMLALIFCILCQVASPLHIDHRGCLIGTATNHRRACIFFNDYKAFYVWTRWRLWCHYSTLSNQRMFIGKKKKCSVNDLYVRATSCGHCAVGTPLGIGPERSPLSLK